MNKKNGFLISVEGVDGSGKSLFSQLLFKALQEQGKSVLQTREPGGTPLSDKIRTLIFSKDTPPSKKTEFLLFAASRAQHADQLIIPALEKNQIVISDRMADSSLVYQGYVQGLPLDFINSVNKWALNNREPDIVFYLKISAKIALKRISQRALPLTLFEDNLTVLEKAIKGFDILVAPRNNVITLDAQKTPSELISEAISFIMPLLNAESNV